MLPVVSFNVGRLPCSEVARLLDQRFQILVRAGLHCAPAAHRSLGSFPSGAVRFSAGWPNTAQEICEALAAVREIAAGGGA
jgi:selenocysteine lyase/cysteine desulfurase